MSDTPETDRTERRWRDYALLNVDDIFDLARRLERERDELRSDLEFRRGLFQLQEQQMDSLREQRDMLVEAIRETIMENKRLKELLEEKETFIQRVITWPHDADPFCSIDHDNDSRNYR